MSYKNGQRVVKVIGHRIEGTIIPPFDIGTLPPATEDAVWVEWSDGSKGWIDPDMIVIAENATFA